VPSRLEQIEAAAKDLVEQEGCGATLRSAFALALALALPPDPAPEPATESDHQLKNGWGGAGEPTESIRPMPEMVHCDSCGLDFTEGGYAVHRKSAFSGCEGKPQPQPQTCPECGLYVKDGYTCRNCGAKPAPDDSGEDVDGCAAWHEARKTEQDGPCFRCGGVGCEACDARKLPQPDDSGEDVDGCAAWHEARKHEASAVEKAREAFTVAALKHYREYPKWSSAIETAHDALLAAEAKAAKGEDS